MPKVAFLNRNVPLVRSFDPDHDFCIEDNLEHKKVKRMYDNLCPVFSLMAK